MRTTPTLLATLLSALLLSCSPGTAASDSSWTLAGRRVPPPEGASTALRDSIAATPRPDVEESLKLLSDDGNIPWQRIIDARSAAQDERALETAKGLGVNLRHDVIDGVKVIHLTPPKIDPRFNNAIFLYVHGGAYVFGGGDASVVEAATIAAFSGIPVLSIDYRMPPTHPFPAAVDDTVAVYRQTIRHTPANRIAIGGISAGGGLTLAAVHKFKELGLDLPAAIYAGTPWADLTKTGDTLFTNEGLDRVLVTYDGLLGAAARLYAGKFDMKNPLISPVYGDFSNFPPTYFLTGTRDMFLSDTARTHRKMRMAGVTAELNVYEGMSHAGYISNGPSPELTQAYSEMRDFLLTHLQ